MRRACWRWHGAGGESYLLKWPMECMGSGAVSEAAQQQRELGWEAE